MASILGIEGEVWVLDVEEAGHECTVEGVGR